MSCFQIKPWGDSKSGATEGSERPLKGTRSWARGKLESSVRAGLGHFLTVGAWPQVPLSLSLLLCEMGSHATAQGLTCVPMEASRVTASVAQCRSCPPPMWRTDATGCGWWDTPRLCAQRYPGDWQAEPLPLLSVRTELGELMWSGCVS